MRVGDYRTVLADDGRRQFAFAREAAEDTVIAAFNADELMHTAELPAAEGQWEDLLNGGRIATAPGQPGADGVGVGAEEPDVEHGPDGSGGPSLGWEPYRG